VEILRLAACSGYRIKEVGVRWRDDGDTGSTWSRGNWRNLVDLLRIRFGRQRAPSHESSALETR
jgi:hypothetical protein